MKKLNKYLIILTSISFLIFLSSIFFSKSEKSLPKKEQTALLNPKYKDSVTKITISKHDNSIILEKIGKFWFASKDFYKNELNVSVESSKTLVDKKLIETLLNNSSKVRDFYTISKNQNDWDKLELSDFNSTFIEFTDSLRNFSKIYFGISDSLSNRIAFRTEKTFSYETEDNFSQFLTLDLNYWSCGEIFYEQKNPQTVKLALFDEKNDSIIKSYSKNSSDKDFSELSHNILAIRHGLIYNDDFNHKLNIEKMNRIAILECYDEDGSISKAIFYKINDEYFVKNQSEKRLADNSIYEISEWTFEKLCDNFEKSNK